MKIITFKQSSLVSKILYFFSKKRRDKRDAATKEAIRYLIANPDEPCIIGADVLTRFIRSDLGSTGIGEILGLKL